ncbi:DUF447 domain-containing protein [Natronorubrum daqingense]|uniref:DUF447 domain-containing protein n=1 Tax=Natronorubrum daqingense TaxID=588898 RepID=A0A1N7DMG6_9EURY|nr:DUF447 domain-containing protein [Natronorubrum daqingense]APX96065.1 hypothetical protein BB347_05220 [Natronorubrum daqingense]SIR77063.1 hypothetical protein SAMN05421809_2127 [Natronorubrum daqingense]
MSDDASHSDPDAPTRESTVWPLHLSGVTESIVSTLGPNGLWNFAALGLFADDEAEGAPITARTWGNTRTRRNFHRQGEGYVVFVDDPVVFADAALSIVEREEPVLECAHAWAHVSVEQTDAGTSDGTEWETWRLSPVEAGIESKTVPTIDRGFAAVVEATVVASRLGVPGYDEETLRERLEYVASVVDRAGSRREKDALERVREHTEW